jgi:hypothetical protein
MAEVNAAKVDEEGKGVRIVGEKVGREKQAERTARAISKEAIVTGILSFDPALRQDIARRSPPLSPPRW